MSKQIKIESKNGADNIRKSRQATNESNWEEDSKVWKLIKNINSNDPKLSKSVTKKGEIKFTYVKENDVTSKGIAKFKIDKEVSEVITTLAKKIANNNPLEYNITDEYEVEFWMILDMLGWLVEAPKKCQKFFCRNASRQSIDELVQIATLDTYVSDAVVNKPTNGSKTLKDGEIIIAEKRSKNKKATIKPRSIDIVVEKYGVSYYMFAKYAKTVGSVTSTLQTTETLLFLDEAKLYVDKNNDTSSCFIVLVDGHAGEMHLDDMRESVKDYPRIYAGNCEEIIDWLNSKINKNAVNTTEEVKDGI